jgi:hypothetical protein
MGNNKHTGQITGSFKANEELFSRMKIAADGKIKSILHLGIQADIGTIFVMNNNEYEIGNTGIYEIENIILTSLKFKHNIDNTIIDYVIEI